MCTWNWNQFSIYAQTFLNLKGEKKKKPKLRSQGFNFEKTLLKLAPRKPPQKKKLMCQHQTKLDVLFKIRTSQP